MYILLFFDFICVFIVRNRCAVAGCENRRNSSTKQFFWSPRNEMLRNRWMEATGRIFQVGSGFVVCQDHFDMTKDVEQRPSDSRLVLKANIVPYLNCGLVSVSSSKLREISCCFCDA